jgi:hypothetical protein
MLFLFIYLSRFLYMLKYTLKCFLWKVSSSVSVTPNFKFVSSLKKGLSTQRCGSWKSVVSSDSQWTGRSRDCIWCTWHFLCCTHQPWGPHSLLYNGYQVSPGCKAARVWWWTRIFSYCQVMNGYTSTSPLCLHTYVMGWPLPFTERWYYCLTFCPRDAGQSDLCWETRGNTLFFVTLLHLLECMSPWSVAVFWDRTAGSELCTGSDRSGQKFR